MVFDDYAPPGDGQFIKTGGKWQFIMAAVDEQHRHHHLHHRHHRHHHRDHHHHLYHNKVTEDRRGKKNAITDNRENLLTSVNRRWHIEDYFFGEIGHFDIPGVW